MHKTKCIPITKINLNDLQLFKLSTDNVYGNIICPGSIRRARVDISRSIYTFIKKKQIIFTIENSKIFCMNPMANDTYRQKRMLLNLCYNLINNQMIIH